MRRLRWSVALLLGAAAVAFGGRLSFQEHAAVQESLSRVHPRMRASWLRAHGLDDSYYTTFHRPESSGLACIGRWPWGPSWELAGRDTFLYLGSGSGVRILSIADSVQPRMLGQINARGLVSQVVVQDSLLFVACGSWGAQIYSVADPANPRELGSMDAVIGDLCVNDSLCYTTGGDYFRIYNTADPSSPWQLGIVYDTRALIVLSGSHAFVASDAGMNVYDVSEPSSPQLVNSRGGSYSTLFVRDTLLFCSDAQPSYFAILDVSDPLSIRQVGNLSGYGGHGLYVDDYFAYLSCTYDHQGIFVIDIANPANPQLRDSLNPEGTENYDSYVPAPLSYGYLASMEGGLVTVDMHNANNLSQAWEGYKADLSLDIAVDNGRAYIADLWVGMHVADVADPTRPVSLGVYDTSDSRGTNAVAARDSFAFLGMSGAYGRRSLRVLDVNEPSNPTLVAEDSCYGWPQGFVLRDSLLYLAEPYQFQVFNVARPSEPVRIGSCGLGGDVWDLDVEDSMAYVTSNVLTMVNISRPDSPYVAATWNTMVAVDVEDTIAYTIGSGAVWSVSVARPTQPYVLDTVGIPDWKSDVVVGESLLFAGGQTLYVIDKRDPRNLRIVGRWTPPHEFRRLLWTPAHVYAACYEAGICVLETLPVGLEEPLEKGGTQANVRLSPSVTTGPVTIMAGRGSGRLSVRLCNGSGASVGESVIQCKLGATTVQLDLSGYPDGVYFVNLRRHGTNFTMKVVKTRRR
jgi:hypothetical protein